MGGKRALTRHDPSKIGPYELTHVIGDGGQGTVYLANDPSGRQVAVKVLKVGFDQMSDGDRRRFLREAEAARKVANFTARILDAGVDDGLPFLVSEYVDGPSLQQVVEREGARDEGALHRIAVNTASALAAIHGAGLVHCDFKPPNVLMGADGPRVIDFGVTRDLAAAQNSTTVFGTPAYMAPEQITGAPIGPAADIFAWALTLSFAATGTPGFGLPTPGDPYGHALLHRIGSQEPDLSGVPDSLRPLLSAALAKLPADRPTALEALHTLLGAGSAAPRLSAAEPQPSTDTDPLVARYPGDRSLRPGRPSTLAVTTLDDQVLAVTFGRGHVRLTDVTARKPLGVLVGVDYPECVACTSIWGRPTAVVGHFNGTVTLWDLTKGAQIGHFQAHAKALSALATTVLDGEPVLATTAVDGLARLWLLPSGERLGELRRTGTPRFGTDRLGTSIEIAESDGQFVVLLCGRDRKQLRLWTVSPGPTVVTLPAAAAGTAPLCSAFFESGSGLFVVAGCRDGALRVCDLSAGRISAEWPVHGMAVEALAVVAGPHGPVVLTADRTGLCRTDLTTGHTDLRLDQADIVAVRPAPDGRSVIALDQRHTLFRYALP